jgi:tetratricopeptide (TPR) repeat protein
MDPTTATALLALAEEASAGASGPNAKDSLERLELRSGDLQEAIAWFVDAGRTDEALRLANALYRFWITKQRFDEGAVWFDRALASPGGDVWLRGKACLNAGFMPFWMGDDERATELFGQALEIARHLDDSPLISGARRIRARGDARRRGRGDHGSPAHGLAPGRAPALRPHGGGAARGHGVGRIRSGSTSGAVDGGERRRRPGPRPLPLRAGRW